MYPDLKYEKWNIILVTFDEHNEKGSAVEHPKYREFIKNIKIKYEEKRN